MATHHTHIAIIGASFAGLSAYLQLRKRLGRDAQITLFDRDDHFTYTPALHECIGNADHLSNIQFPFKKYYGNDFKKHTISDIHQDHFMTQSGDKWTFDYLVIATGSRTSLYDNDSFIENGYTYRTAQDVQRLADAITDDTHIISVVGGGYTGVEVATACKEAYPDITVRLIHSRDRVFHQYDEKVSDRIAQYCAKKKIDIITNQRVKHISKTTIELSEGDEYPSDITILTAGIRINDDSHSDNLSFDETHATDKKYCPVESDNVFACGDVACHGLSATAHNAMIEGRRIANIIANKIKETPKEYPAIKNRDKLALALGTRDGIFTSGTHGIYIPYIVGAAKKVIEYRVMREFKYHIMLPI